MGIKDDGHYRRNSRGKLIIVYGVPMLEVGEQQVSISELFADFDGKEVCIDISDASKENRRIRARYGSQPK